MAQFRATIRGQRGEASRLGSKQSGLVVCANGWNGGVRVEAMHNSGGNDQFDIYATGGSNGGGFGRVRIGHVDGKGVFHPDCREG